MEAELSNEELCALYLAFQNECELCNIVLMLGSYYLNVPAALMDMEEDEDRCAPLPVIENLHSLTIQTFALKDNHS